MGHRWTPYHPTGWRVKATGWMKKRRRPRFGQTPLLFMKRENTSELSSPVNLCWTNSKGRFNTKANGHRMASKKKSKGSKKKTPTCGNPLGCIRPANGTDGIGYCMHCEDDTCNYLREVGGPWGGPWGGGSFLSKNQAALSGVTQAEWERWNKK